jgi:hypothetical protein
MAWIAGSSDDAYPGLPSWSSLVSEMKRCILFSAKAESPPFTAQAKITGSFGLTTFRFRLVQRFDRLSDVCAAALVD